MPSLLEKAKKVRGKKLPNASPELLEQCELALAVFAGQVTSGQAMETLGSKATSANNVLGALLARGIRAGIVKAELVAK